MSAIVGIVYERAAACNGYERLSSSERSKVRHLYLPGRDGGLQPCGLILDQIARGLPWENYGFQITNDKIFPTTEDPNMVSHRLRALTCDAGTLANYPDIPKWVYGNNQEFINVIGAHPQVRIPDYLGVHIGTLQAGAHLTIFAGDYMWVQIRSATASVYPNMYDQIAAGGVQEGETFRDTLLRETAEEVSPATMELVRNQVHLDGIVSYTNIRDHASGKFVGQIEPGVKASYSVQVGPHYHPNQSSSSDVATFVRLSFADLVESLRRGQWKPNSALVALFALAKNPGCMGGNRLSSEEVQVIVENLQISQNRLAKLQHLL